VEDFARLRDKADTWHAEFVSRSLKGAHALKLRRPTMLAENLEALSVGGLGMIPRREVRALNPIRDPQFLAQ
jgi:hypothetical protein